MGLSQDHAGKLVIHLHVYNLLCIARDFHGKIVLNAAKVVELPFQTGSVYNQAVVHGTDTFEQRSLLRSQTAEPFHNGSSRLIYDLKLATQGGHSTICAVQRKLLTQALEGLIILTRLRSVFVDCVHHVCIGQSHVPKGVPQSHQLRRNVAHAIGQPIQIRLKLIFHVEHPWQWVIAAGLLVEASNVRSIPLQSKIGSTRIQTARLAAAYITFKTPKCSGIGL
mmetsp:Transcript_758/g.1822  ORF Transcript_758/g.1822 Transcript_758/m.1822 type:complete len:223 (-) Transcript_758:850-1518(-)